VRKNIYYPSLRDIRKARKLFLENEPRDLFYRAAIELVDLAMKGKAALTLTEALAVLLQTWNRAYYQFRPFNASHFNRIDKLIGKYGGEVRKFRSRNILGLKLEDRAKIKGLFRAFEKVLGPVGASKTLHLLAPRFFPLLDRSIAQAYGLPLDHIGTNASRYFEFMNIAKEQCRKLSDKLPSEDNCLKAIDEFNYCRHTKKWI